MNVLMQCIDLNETQANASTFPPGCPVYLLYDDDENGPPGIDAQGIVDGAVLVPLPLGGMFATKYRVNVKCKGDDGLFCARSEIIEQSNLRFRNGCSVRFRLQRQVGSKKDEVWKDGIVLGFCDIPDGERNQIWYIVKEIYGAS